MDKELLPKLKSMVMIASCPKFYKFMIGLGVKSPDEINESVIALVMKGTCDLLVKLGLAYCVNGTGQDYRAKNTS